ncbi:MAG: leucine-rich repeat domain-containing protein [Flavicella sp.]
MYKTLFFVAIATIFLSCAEEEEDFYKSYSLSKPLAEQIPDANFRKAIERGGMNAIDLNDDDVITLDEVEVYDGKLDLSHSYQTENPITDLTGIALFVNLTELNCSGHALTSIDISSNLNLVELRCTNNLMTSLDVSNNQLLQWLYCSENTLSSLDLSSNKKLRTLFCGQNKLESLDLFANTSLYTIYCEENQLEELIVPPFEISEDSSSILEINCSNNKLSQIDLSEAKHLSTLKIVDNRLTHLDLSYQNSLYWLHLNGNGSLTCIKINERQNPYSSTYEWYFDSHMEFSENCESNE